MNAVASDQIPAQLGLSATEQALVKCGRPVVKGGQARG